LIRISSEIRLGTIVRGGAVRINRLDDPPQPVSAAADGRKDRIQPGSKTDKRNTLAQRMPCMMRRRSDVRCARAALVKSDREKWGPVVEKSGMAKE
jgi:hypothetical protein